jgi:pSer/pThr/pTyr-binding forkhead associated (FHA) protein
MAYSIIESAKLLVKLHGHGSRTIDLARDSFTIGRRVDNDLPIDDHTVSSHHAKIVRVQSVYFVEDLKSTNGTTLNGKPIERAQLHDADVTGWFAPKMAALITHRGGAYSISCSQGSKKLLVNGKEVCGQQQLKDGDAIEVAGVSMTFYVVSPQHK